MGILSGTLTTSFTLNTLTYPWYLQFTSWTMHDYLIFAFVHLKYLPSISFVKPLTLEYFKKSSECFILLVQTGFGNPVKLCRYSAWRMYFLHNVKYLCTSFHGVIVIRPPQLTRPLCWTRHVEISRRIRKDDRCFRRTGYTSGNLAMRIWPHGHPRAGRFSLFNDITNSSTKC